MGLWDALFGRKPDEAKAAPPAILQRVGVAGLPEYPEVSVGNLVKARRRNELVYACIKIKADAAIDPRLMVQRRGKGSEWQEDEGHPLRRLLMRPNPEMDEAAFLRAGIVSMDVAGVFYCEIVRSRAGLPVQLWPLRPGKITPIYEKNADGSATLIHYQWKDGQLKKIIPLENMLVRRDWEMGAPLAPLAVALGSVDADNAQTDFIRAYFNNAGVPSGIIKVKGRTLREEESAVIRASWRAKYGRQWGNQHDVAVMDENAEYQRVGSNLAELDSETLRSTFESRICMVFGVPPLIVYAYVGLLRATYSNLKEAWAGFWDATMSPLLKDWRSWLTWNLLVEFEDEELILAERVRLMWDLSQVAALQDDVDATHERARKAFISGGITLDEYRSKVGEKPYPDAIAGGMNPYLLRVMTVVGSGNQASPDDTAAPAADGSAPENIEATQGLNGAQIAAALAILERLAAGALSDEQAVELIIMLGVAPDKAQAIVDAQPAVDLEAEPKALPGPTGHKAATRRDRLERQVQRDMEKYLKGQYQRAADAIREAD